MRERVGLFVRYYCFWVLFFVLQKPVFMACQYGLLGDVRWTDWFLVPWHGLPLDLSVSAYITVVYGVLLCVSVWAKGAWLRWAARVYTALVLAVAMLVVLADNGCFPSWGYHLDKDVFAYLATPREVFACAPWWQWVLGVGCWLLGVGFWLWVAERLRLTAYGVQERPVVTTAVLVVLTALLFLPMRGSVSVSTMNTGRAYYSPNRMLNLAAVNPLFNIMESLSENRFDSSRYHYMPSDEAAEVLSAIRPDSGSPGEQILNTSRPNIVLVVLESFCKTAWEAMPNLRRLSSEGVYFSNIYANSYRTDRGLVAILGAFPGGASGSVMLVPSKSQNLPQIGQVLKADGYDLRFYYGGDEDFTNMRSYLVTGGFEQRVSDHDFPLSDRLSKWGVPDHIVFDYAARSIVRHASSTTNPLFAVVLSLSSHEPFDVPYHHYAHPYLNAVAYTDSCLGAFVDSLRQSPMWENTVVVLTADHGYPYPQGLANYAPLRYGIPLVMAGGAVRGPREIKTLGSQIDWVPTLLHQMDMDAEQFAFAKDLLDTVRAPYAYYHFVDGFAYITDSDTTIIDRCAEGVQNTDRCADRHKAEAVTQRIYESLD